MSRSESGLSGSARSQDASSLRLPARLVDYFAVVGVLPRSTDEGESSTIPREYGVLQRYPEVDHEDFHFPSFLPKFCMPAGVPVTITTGHFTPTPLPRYFTSVFVGDGGVKVYCACLILYEPLEKGNDSVVVAKVVCLLSHHGFMDSFKSYLTTLYRLCLSPSRVPIEAYVKNIVVEAPFPTRGFTTKVFVGDQPISFSRPAMTQMPMSDFPISVLFECLDIENALLLVNCLLQERKVVVYSSRISVLTLICEAAIALMFPLTWVHMYLPVLPRDTFTSLRDVCYPFLIGVHRTSLKEVSFPPDTIFFDLDANSFHGSLAGTTPIISLPRKERAKAIRRLTRVLGSRQRPTTEQRFSSTVDLDTAFYMPPTPDSSSSRINTFEGGLLGDAGDMIREIFLRMFLSLFKRYRSFFREIHLMNEQIQMRGRAQLPKHADACFDKAKFIYSHSNHAKDFLAVLVNTMGFDLFILDHCRYDPKRPIAPQDDDLKTFNAYIQRKMSGRKRGTIVQQRTFDSLASTTAPIPSSQDGETYQHDSFPTLNLSRIPFDAQENNESDDIEEPLRKRFMVSLNDMMKKSLFTPSAAEQIQRADYSSSTQSRRSRGSGGQSPRSPRRLMRSPFSGRANSMPRFGSSKPAYPAILTNSTSARASTPLLSGSSTLDTSFSATSFESMSVNGISGKVFDGETKWKGEKAVLVSKVESLTKRLEEAETKLAGNSGAGEKSSASFADNAVDVLTIERDGARAEVQRLRNKVTEMTKASIEARTALANAEKELHQARSEVEVLRESCEKAENERNTLSEQIELYKQKYGFIQGEECSASSVGGTEEMSSASEGESRIEELDEILGDEVSSALEDSNGGVFPWLRKKISGVFGSGGKALIEGEIGAPQEEVVSDHLEKAPELGIEWQSLLAEDKSKALENGTKSFEIPSQWTQPPVGNGVFEPIAATKEFEPPNVSPPDFTDDRRSSPDDFLSGPDSDDDIPAAVSPTDDEIAPAQGKVPPSLGSLKGDSVFSGSAEALVSEFVDDDYSSSD